MCQRLVLTIKQPKRCTQLGEDEKLLAVLLKTAMAISNTQQVGICSVVFTPAFTLGMLYVSIRDGIESTGIFVETH